MSELSVMNTPQPFYLPQGTMNFNLNERGFLDQLSGKNGETPFQYVNPDFVEIIKQDIINFGEGPIRFSDDVWDFKDKSQNEFNKRTYTYRFSDIKDDYYKMIVKTIVLSELLVNGIHRPYIQINYYHSKKFIKYLLSKSIFYIEDLSLENVMDYFDSSDYDFTYRNKAKYKTSIKSLLDYFGQFTNLVIDQDIIDYLEDHEDSKIKIEARNNKTYLIPSNQMIPLKRLLWNEFNNETNSDDKRRRYALLYIDSEIGIRAGELLMLPYDCIVEKQAIGFNYYIIHYIMTKSVYGKGYDEAETRATDEVVKCVEFLRSKVQESQSLGTGLNTNKLLKSLRTLIKHNKEWFGNNYDTRLENIKMVHFRVYVATELRRRGINDFQISKMLGHHDEKMFGYYARGVDSIQEDIEFSKSIVKDVLKENTKILGPRGDINMNRIRNKLRNHTINVQDSLDDIIKDFIEDLPIRQKAGGFCICANSSRTCDVDIDEDINEVLCAYGLCSNQCHVYYDLNYYYNEFQRNVLLYLKNRKAGHKNATEKQLYIMQRKLEDYIIPEINELEKILEEKGEEHVISLHPEMLYIINNLNKIKKEVEIWKNKTM